MCWHVTFGWRSLHDTTFNQSRSTFQLWIRQSIEWLVALFLSSTVIGRLYETTRCQVSFHAKNPAHHQRLPSKPWVPFLLQTINHPLLYWEHVCQFYFIFLLSTGKYLRKSRIKQKTHWSLLPHLEGNVQPNLLQTAASWNVVLTTQKNSLLMLSKYMMSQIDYLFTALVQRAASDMYNTYFYRISSLDL